MSSYEFTPNGLRERSEGEQSPAGVIGARAAVESIRAQAAAQPAALAPAAAPTSLAQGARITRKSFVPELRARLRVVQSEIKRMRGLEDEEAELKRLIAAAKAPPASVTPIHQARKSS